VSERLRSTFCVSIGHWLGMEDHSVSMKKTC
jgi:hypothetical protein